MCVWVQPHILSFSQSFFYRSYLSQLPLSHIYSIFWMFSKGVTSFRVPLSVCISLLWLVSVSVWSLFLIRQWSMVGSILAGHRWFSIWHRTCLCIISYLKKIDFFDIHPPNTDTETQRDCLILDSQAVNYPHALATLTYTPHKDIAHECFTRSAAEEVGFFITIPAFLSLSVWPPLCLHLPFVLLFGLVCLIRWGKC